MCFRIQCIYIFPQNAELDIKYLKTGLDTDLRPHKQTTLKCIEGKRKPHTNVGSLALLPVCTQYTADGSNHL